MRLLGTAALTACLALPLHASPYKDLRKAARAGDLAKVRAMIEGGMAIPLDVPVWACDSGNSEMLTFLVERGAPLNGDFQTISPLQMCTVRNQLEMVRYLLDHGATIGRYEQQDARKYPQVQALFAERLAQPAQPRRAPGNLDDAAYARMRASAGLPPETKEVASDVDVPKGKAAERPDDFALVIGIEEYQSVPKADWGVRDAKAVRKHLEALGFPPRNIISLEGSRATGSKLKSYLEEWLPLNVKPTSTLFVYYSGHGAPDPKSGEAYLVPWDGDAAFLKSTALPIKKLYSDLAKIKAKRVIVALDACFSGAGGRSVLAQGARPLVTKTEDLKPAGAITVLAAASGDEITGALNEQGHGMFTYFLLKGLASGKTSARELMEYVSPKVQDEARRQNRQQTPAMLGDDTNL